jgi:uncharacterized protein DUF1501
MIDLFTGWTRDCEGFSRREFLKVGMVSVLGLALPDFLRMRAASADSSREISCILLWMNGGPSHLDTFDPKPDAPQEIRGDFKAIPTNVAGIQLSEYLPKLAKQQDKFTILRSVTSPDGSHESATSYLLTGYRFTPAIDYPAYGSVYGREKGFRNGMPPYALIGGYPFGYGGGGYMGAEYNPFNVGGDPSSPSFSVQDVAPPKGVDLARIDRRRTMLSSLDLFQRNAETRPATIRTMDSFYEKAYDLVTSPVAKKAFDLGKEPDKLRDAYGRNTFGQSCLLARRMIEAGVRFVTINRGGWDTHTDNFKSLKERRLPELDQGYAALLEDLAQRGMLDTTLVIWMGEFGRTPKVNASAGRDHWPYAMCVCMGGGGIKTGMAIGETNERAEVPKDRPIKVEDVAATIYHALGIPADKEYQSAQNRPVKVADGGQVIQEVI